MREIYSPQRADSAESKLFSIEKGQNLFQIAENLEQEGLIKNRLLFDFYVILKGKQRKLPAGKYELSPAMSVSQVAQIIVFGKTYQIKIVIPEGLTIKQIVEILAANRLTNEDISKFRAKDFNDGFEFLKDAPAESSLEGFLFPDTYYIEPERETEETIKIFLDNFDKKLTSELREEIKKQDKKIFEIITMASLIEKEVLTLSDKKLVSGILWKRLKTGMPLQVDATISYVTGKKTARVSYDDLQIDSPYNTYKYRGLPPGPISNPGIESIEATIEPKDSLFWYYLSTPEGETIFSKTLQEHNVAIARYLR